MVSEHAVSFRSGALTLEGRLGVPPDAIRAVVICHPHPQYGGDMDNGVVIAIGSALRQAGMATLRFNFRGAGASAGCYDSGIGETDDARAAVALMRQQASVRHVALAGYSFGAMVALRAAYDRADVERLIAVGPPLPMFDATFLDGCTKPTLFVIGDRDQYCPIAAVERTAAAMPAAHVIHLPGADHFFGTFEAQIGHVVTQFASEACPPAPRLPSSRRGARPCAPTAAPHEARDFWRATFYEQQVGVDKGGVPGIHVDVISPCDGTVDRVAFRSES